MLPESVGQRFHPSTLSKRASTVLRRYTLLPYALLSRHIFRAQTSTREGVPTAEQDLTASGPFFPASCDLQRPSHRGRLTAVALGSTHSAVMYADSASAHLRCEDALSPCATSEVNYVEGTQKEKRQGLESRFACCSKDRGFNVEVRGNNVLIDMGGDSEV